MYKEDGFTLVEAMIAIVLLGILALFASVNWTNRGEQTTSNAATHLADQAIEECRNKIGGGTLSDLGSSTGSFVANGTTYYREITVSSYRINSITDGGSYQLINGSSGLLINGISSTGTGFNDPTQVIKQATVTIRQNNCSGAILLQRTAIFR